MPKTKHQSRANGDSFFSVEQISIALNLIKKTIDKETGNDEKLFLKLIDLQDSLSMELRYIKKIKT